MEQRALWVFCRWGCPALEVHTARAPMAVYYNTSGWICQPPVSSFFPSLQSRPCPPQPLLEKLFGGFKLPESSENEYLMKAVMRVIG